MRKEEPSPLLKSLPWEGSAPQEVLTLMPHTHLASVPSLSCCPCPWTVPPGGAPLVRHTGLLSQDLLLWTGPESALLHALGWALCFFQLCVDFKLRPYRLLLIGAFRVTHLPPLSLQAGYIQNPLSSLCCVHLSLPSVILPWGLRTGFWFDMTTGNTWRITQIDLLGGAVQTVLSFYVRKE